MLKNGNPTVSIRLGSELCHDRLVGTILLGQAFVQTGIQETCDPIGEDVSQLHVP